MNQQIDTQDSIEIGNLEYDVGGMGSEESSGSEANYAAHYMISYLKPDTK